MGGWIGEMRSDEDELLVLGETDLGRIVYDRRDLFG
jgi:hypothetical protein